MTNGAEAVAGLHGHLGDPSPRRALASYTVVVPTIGRPSLATLLHALDAGFGPGPAAVVVVDDRRAPGGPLDLPRRVAGAPVDVVRSGGAGPAAARNAGLRRARTEWVAFLDDDVVPSKSWAADLVADLSAAAPGVGGSQGRIRVPRPAGRHPTDWERNVIALEGACWATADLAYRRSVLAAVGGFDERFPRAFREDTDLGLRVSEAGWAIVRGRRWVAHPVRRTDRWISVRAQRGNRDDVLLRALHGPGWRERSAAGPSRNGRHLATTTAAAAGVAGLLLGRPVLAFAGAAGWLAGTAELAWARVRRGPASPDELGTMLATSAAIPPVATWHLVAGLAALPRTLARPRPRPAPVEPVRAVLFDRDGTLVEDVPYNGRPDQVRPVPGAAAALQRLRDHGLKVGVITNQSGVARGLITAGQVEDVNRRVDELVGPFDTWQSCLHGPDDGCACRKPEPALVQRAAAALGVPPAACVVVGDIGADVGAAVAAGARAILVPTPATLANEVAQAPEVAGSLEAATDLILGEPVLGASR